MKAIINLKKYDTDTAHVIAGPVATFTPNDPRYCEETLYQKTTGEYFLVGHGGLESRYGMAAMSADTKISSPAIFPVADETAKTWAASLMDCDEYEAIFGPVEE